ncbi:UNVERIFIED_ORG: enamine deaminase RidA (YjgF/YER057c/UK114 family) [Gordonia westfalica J30]
MTPAAQGDYLTAVRHETVIFTAGMTPRLDGVLTTTGIFGRDLTVSAGREPAKQAASNALAAATSALAAGEEIDRCVRLTVYVAATRSFTEHSRIADFASQRIREELGEEAIGVRTTIGVASLPGGAPIEIELTASVLRR